MRVLMVTADFPPEVGGMQAYSWELAHAWAKSASAMTVIAPRHPSSTQTDQIAGFEVRRVPYAGDSFVFSGALPVQQAIATLRPDAIFATSWACAAGALSAQLFRRVKTPVFAAAHGRELILRPLERMPPLQRAYDALRHAALAGSKTVFPVSRFTAGLLRERGVPDDRIEVVCNGVDPEKYHPKDASALRQRLGLADKTVLLTIGRLVERKGIDTVLKVLPTLVREVPDLAYVIVGEGPDRARLEGLIEASGVGSHVHMVGHVPFETLVDYYNLCEVFVMPARSDSSDIEGFGLVFFEASACGKPVVGARSGGVTDAVIENETGCLIEPNDVQALSAVLLDLLTHPVRAKQMGERGRRHVVEHGTWEQSARRIFDTMRARVS